MLPPEDDFMNIPSVRLVELAQAGNEEAFDALFNYYKPGVGKYLAGLVRCPEDRDELVQDTMIKAWRKLSTLRDTLIFEYWLYAIARNLAYDYFRRTRDRDWQSRENLETNDARVSVPDSQEYIAEIEILKLALVKIPKNYRECLLLQTVAGFSRREVAELIGISEESVSTYVSNARKLLRNEYQRQGRELPGEEKGDQTDG